MKILIIGLYNKLGGIEKCIFDYVSHMDLSKVSIGFIGSPVHIWFEKELQKLGCVIHPVCERRNVFHYYHELCKVIKENNYDLVHINMLSFANCVPLLAAKKCGVKIICHSHNSAIPKGTLLFPVKALFHSFNKFLFQKSRIIRLACSKSAGEFLYGKKSKFIVLRNAINTRKFSFNEKIRIEKREKLGIPGNATVLGHVGRFEYQKNHEFSINLFAEFVKEHPNSFLLFVGTGSLETECRKKIQKYGLDKKVLFCGQQNDITSFLFAMDIFLFPSNFEGLGIAGIEAQCAGLPVIASNTISSEMKQTDLVTWCDLNSSISNWISAINERLLNTPKRQLYPEIIAERGFDISQQSANLLNIYKSCMEE